MMHNKLESELEKKIDQFIAANRQNIIRDIRSLVNIKSVSIDDGRPGMPFGEGCKKVLDKALSLCEDLGFQTKNYDYYAGSAQLQSPELGPDAKEIAILGHLDVVPEGSGWSHDPYDMIEKDDYLYGRGVSDDKGPTVLGLYALACFRELGLPLHYNYRLAMGCSEETSPKDMDYYRSHEKMPVFAFTPDADFSVCIGEKGALSVEILLPVDGKTISSFSGGTVANAVCASATASLCGLSEADLGEYCHKTYSVEPVAGGIALTATGVTSHAAKPEGSVNATKLLCELLATLPKLSAAERKAAAAVVELLKDYNGAGIGVAVEDEPSGKLTHINGLVSMQDSTIVLNLNIRYPVTLSGAELFSRIQNRVAGMGFSAKLSNDSVPCYRPANTPEVQALLAAYNHVTGEQSVPYTIGGGTYARHFPNAVAFGPHFEAMVNPAGEGKGSEHMPDECNSIEFMMKAVKIYTIALVNLNELSL